MLGLFSTFIFVFVFVFVSVFVCVFVIVIVIADVILYPMMYNMILRWFEIPRLEMSKWWRTNGHTNKQNILL